MQQPNLDNFQTISFDIFDTLVHRHTYAPMDIFDGVRSKLMMSDLALLHPKLIGNFPEIRRTSEIKARQVRTEQFNDSGEITFDEIYDQLALQYPIDNYNRQLLQETELALERLFLYRSKDGYALYNEAVNKNKQILFISDMYLPTEFLIERLQALGYHYANQNTVFVSAEHRCNKHTGQLYQLVKEKLNLTLQSWLHIGDNTHADVESAKKIGLSAHHATWAKVHNVPRYNQKISDAIPASIIDGINLPQHQAIYQPENGYRKLGYEVFGPIIFGYYTWLLNQLNELKPDKILYFARDAYLIQKIHEIASLEHQIDSKYVYISRKSIYPLSLTDFPLWRTNHLVNSRVPRTLQTICDNYDINLSQFTIAMAHYGLSADTIITPHNSNQAVQFLSTCFTELAQHSIKNRQQFLEYFLDMIDDASKVAIIDIGWSGNIQSAFSRALQEKLPNCQFFGLYLGLSHFAQPNISAKNSMAGYFMNLHQNPKNAELISQGGAELLEFVLTAPEGSTIGYQQNEYGKIIPILEEKTHDEQDYEQKALETQEGVLAFVKNHAFLLQQFPLSSLNSLKWAEPFCELVSNPTREQITLLADLTHSDGAGNNQQRLSLAPKLPYFHRLFRTKTYKRAYEQAFWKKGFYYRNQRDPRKYRG